ncbi:DMT family transporter [Uliginosibacterium sp. H1]|uniref:DMT family transporter n=1 Tax=Uliginosibacterium sp. H1 TaxID=3114757 RepID=UPI002E1727CC|nr:DMT family transporter [Uliginosibacterium sp. H1]
MSSHGNSPATARWSLLALLAGGICIAFAPIFVRLADTGPVSVVVWRMGLSIPFVLALAWNEGSRAVREASPQAWLWLVVSGLMLGADLALWHIAIHMTSVANSTFLINLAPLFVTLGAWWFLSERVGSGFVLALVCAIAGAALLVRASFGTGEALRGDMVALLAAVFYAGYQLTVKYCRRYFSTWTILAGTASVAAISLLPVVVALDETFWPRSAQGWGAVVGIALVCQVLGQGLITWAVGHIRANMASIGLLIQPVTAAWLAVLIFGETMAVMQVLGCVLVLFGIALARRNNRG